MDPAHNRCISILKFLLTETSCNVLYSVDQTWGQKEKLQINACPAEHFRPCHCFLLLLHLSPCYNVSEAQPDTGQTVPPFHDPLGKFNPLLRGWHCVNFAVLFGNRKLEWLGLLEVKELWHRQQAWWTDRQTDRLRWHVPHLHAMCRAAKMWLL